jgi:tetratricopeptide (TPR) repeat protein
MSRVSLPAAREDHDLALHHTRIAIALRPAAPAGYLQLGALLREREPDKALAAYLRAFELTPRGLSRTTLPPPILQLIEARDGPAGVIAFLQRKVDEDPNDAWAHFDLAATLKQQDRLDEALAEVRRAIHIRPTVGRFHDEAGNLIRRLKQPDRQQSLAAAEAEHRNARTMSQPRHWTDGTNLTMVLRMQKRYREALEADEELLSTFPWAARLSLNGVRPHFSAAVSAMLAVTEGGSNADPKVSQAELRRKALAHLQIELNEIKMRLTHDPNNALPGARSHLERMLENKAFVPVREPAAIDRLPLNEQDEWRRFWDEVRNIHVLTTRWWFIPLLP